MLYQIIHTNTYTYTRPVDLDPHFVRLRPRSNSFQTLQDFSLEVAPAPAGLSELLDYEGNNIHKIWFFQPTAQLTIKITAKVETHCSNPFNFILEAWAVKLPISDYPAPVLAHLQPYLTTTPDPAIIQLAQEIWQAVDGQTLDFLSILNQRIYQTCAYTLRETGDPLPAGLTWTQQLGSCRDTAVVFIEACRLMGLAARFVSGYHETDPDHPESHLHAWAEVYLPGAGWRGYDPTQGLAVADRHIALVASAIPRHAGPISGSFKGIGASSEMNYTLSIQTL